jgi:hypothetical protein
LKGIVAFYPTTMVTDPRLIAWLGQMGTFVNNKKTISDRFQRPTTVAAMQALVGGIWFSIFNDLLALSHIRQPPVAASLATTLAVKYGDFYRCASS